MPDHDHLRHDGRWEGQLRLPDGHRKSVNESSEDVVIERLADAAWRLDHGLPLRVSLQSTRNYLAY